MRLRFGAGMRHRALDGRADNLGIAPQRAGLVIVLARLPGLAALGEHSLVDQQVDRARFGVDADLVAILDQRDRAAVGRLGPDMADAEAARRRPRSARR